MGAILSVLIYTPLMKAKLSKVVKNASKHLMKYAFVSHPDDHFIFELEEERPKPVRIARIINYYHEALVTKRLASRTSNTMGMIVN